MSFKDTLNLPRTDFPMRPNAKIDDPAMLERWQAENLYEKAFVANSGAEKYILHDGPPYANGHIHLGHAYNKILKDMVTKSRRMQGLHVPVTPGWDCHGLPIELKVTKDSVQPAIQIGTDAHRFAVKQACRSYAAGWINTQREEFKRLGVVMNWDNPYITMDPAYEANIVRAFGKFVADGFIARKNKSVAWCASCATTLATAEIEYKDRKDSAVYVEFPLLAETIINLFPIVTEPVSLLIWTTTPWTLPLNRAVALKPETSYQLVRLQGKLVIMGAQVVSLVAKKINAVPEIIQEFSSDIFAGVKLQHPFIEELTVPVVFDESTGATEGTASVHIAPGCGPIDYEIGVKNNLEIYSPITADGKYASLILPAELADMPVADGQIWVIKKLAVLGRLFFKESLTHSYPHCWRCRNGLIFRATPQWFVDLNKHNMKQRALAAIEIMKFVPEQGKNFLRATVENRWEWCLSRQRIWGVPIPALLCKSCDYVHSTPELINRTADAVQTEGIEYWDRVMVQELVDACPELVQGCPKCASHTFEKENDILDVWFDSGVSHFAVLEAMGAFPADLYLEGVDQYRGWYQSSLLTGLVVEKQAPMRAIMSHGFTVDGKGQKMSKSLGNVVAPQEIIDQLGTDGLRLWVASIGHSSDAVVSDVLLKNVAEVFRKIRNTCRFLLQNLYDFDITRDAVALDKLLLFDQYALARLAAVHFDVLKAYDAYNFTEIFHTLADYCAVDLSSEYLDVVKDRLYVEKADGHARRSAQTVLWYMLDALTKLIAPILSFTAEQLADLYQKDKTSSIHLQRFADTQKFARENDSYKKLWEFLHEVRGAVLKAIEPLREQGVIKHSLEAQVTLHFAPELFVEHQDFVLYATSEFFKEFLIVSQVAVVKSLTSLPGNGSLSQIEVAAGDKCQRCWHYDSATNAAGLCSRCHKIVA